MESLYDRPVRTRVGGDFWSHPLLPDDDRASPFADGGVLLCMSLCTYGAAGAAP